MNKASPELGAVREVDGRRVMVDVGDRFEATLSIPVGEGRDYVVGQPGSLVTINVGPRTRVIGLVTAMRMAETVGTGEDGRPAAVERKRFEAQLIGELSGGRFRRGVGSYPVVGSKVFAPDDADIAALFGDPDGNGLSVGRLTQPEGSRCFIRVDRFFGRHAAVVGMTGTGKSSAVAGLLQKASDPARCPHAHIVILDTHNEYRIAFPSANYLSGDSLKLPYWLLNFAELREVFADRTEHAALNQIRFFRDAVLALKRENLEKQLRDIAGLIGETDARRLLRERLTVDTPVYFDLRELLARAEREDAGRSRSSQYLQNFILRLRSKLEDRRLGFLTDIRDCGHSAVLPAVIENLLNAGGGVTIVDLSGVPSEARSVVVSVVARTAFDFNLWNPWRRQYPICLVCEEAHAYLAESRSGETGPAGEQIGRIAREGRKYGVGLIVVSQRPTELPAAVLSQCGTFVAFRLTNEADQGHVRRLTPDSAGGLLEALPNLQQGEALLIGEAAPMPCRVMLDGPDPAPSGDDVPFDRSWREGPSGFDMGAVVRKWWLQEKDG